MECPINNWDFLLIGRRYCIDIESDIWLFGWGFRVSLLFFFQFNSCIFFVLLRLLILGVCHSRNRFNFHPHTGFNQSRSVSPAKATKSKVQLVFLNPELIAILYGMCNSLFAAML